MKKTVIVKGERRKVEFEYRVIDKLVSCQKSKRWDKQGDGFRSKPITTKPLPLSTV